MSIIWFLWLSSAALYGSVSAATGQGNQCPIKRPPSYLSTLPYADQQLYIGVPVNFLMKEGDHKRYSLQLNESIPLLINITASPKNIARRLYFNETMNLSKHIRQDLSEIFIPCATNGQYDVILWAKHQSSIRIEVLGTHPSANWPLLNRSIPIRVKYQTRMQKKQMIVRWNKSKLDIHAMHYCLVINTKSPQKDFCNSVRDSINSKLARPICTAPIDNIWTKQADRDRKIDPDTTNVYCTGSKTKLTIMGLLPHMRYFIDIFGVHTKLQNLTFLLTSTIAWFNQTHPNTLQDNSMTIGKISGYSKIAVFSYKIPQNRPVNKNIKFLVLPCDGSEVDVKILKRKKELRLEPNVYKPTYITLSDINAGDRLIIRVKPTNDDEIPKANKVGVAVTTKGAFMKFPELPKNSTVFEIRTFRNCKSTIVVWHQSPETRRFRYCVIVLQLPNDKQGSLDQTNYCMDFGKKVTEHPQFYRIECFEPTVKKFSSMEHFTLVGLQAGNSYLVYVTVQLLGGKPLPYESLKINVNRYCQNDLDDSLLRNSSYYDN